MSLTIDLPWPSKTLHPNARVHWAVRAKAAKKARADAALLARTAEGRDLFIHDGMTRIPVSLTFHPPDNRHRDQDGMISACKAYLDGIADGLMVNDRLFTLSAMYFMGPAPGGQVTVTIFPALEALGENYFGER